MAPSRCSVVRASRCCGGRETGRLVRTRREQPDSSNDTATCSVTAGAWRRKTAKMGTLATLAAAAFIVRACAHDRRGGEEQPPPLDGVATVLERVTQKRAIRSLVERCVHFVHRQSLHGLPLGALLLVRLLETYSFLITVSARTLGHNPSCVWRGTVRQLYPTGGPYRLAGSGWRVPRDRCVSKS